MGNITTTKYQPGKGLDVCLRVLKGLGFMIYSQCLALLPGASGSSSSLVVNCFEQDQSQLRNIILPCRGSLDGKSTSSKKVVADHGGTWVRTLVEVTITWLWG